MTEQLMCRIYKLSNSEDDKIYIGSTRGTLAQRIGGHRDNARKGLTKPVSAHMRKIGIDKFKITLIKEKIVTNRKEMRIEEQNEMEKYDKTLLLNVLRAYSENREKTRDQDKKRKTRRDFYHRHKMDPDWIEKERERNRLKMRIVRATAKEAKRNNNN